MRPNEILANVNIHSHLAGVLLKTENKRNFFVCSLVYNSIISYRLYLGSCCNNELLSLLMSAVCPKLSSIVSLEMSACAIINEQCLQSVSLSRLDQRFSLCSFARSSHLLTACLQFLSLSLLSLINGSRKYSSRQTWTSAPFVRQQGNRNPWLYGREKGKKI